MANTFRVGEMTVHRIVEMECGFTPALEFLPALKPEVLAENRSWLVPRALDAQDKLVLCFPVIRRANHRRPDPFAIASALSGAGDKH